MPAAPTVVIVVKVVPSVERWIFTPVWLVAVLVQVRLICDPEIAVAVSPDGAVGIVVATAVVSSFAPAQSA